jgi:hypothetical protein
MYCYLIAINLNNIYELHIILDLEMNDEIY